VSQGRDARFYDGFTFYIEKMVGENLGIPYNEAWMRGRLKKVFYFAGSLNRRA